ncbi:hypothetical protein M2110_001405 [Paenibacillus sp. PastF-4]|nr:hypothetical protein [Paenibacillus sp. PastF-4]
MNMIRRHRTAGECDSGYRTADDYDSVVLDVGWI